MEEQRFYLWENFYLSKSTLKRDSWDKLESFGILTVKYTQTKVMFERSQCHESIKQNNCLVLPFDWKLPSEGLLKMRVMCDNWFILTKCLWFSPPSSHRDHPDPREKRYASIWISKAFLDKSMHCTSVFRTFIYGQKVLGQPVFAACPSKEP